jgi:hypothetical protein
LLFFFHEGVNVPKTELDRTILEAALEGLERRLEETNGRIAEVRRLLSGRRAQAAPAPATPAKRGRKKRTMSAAARKRIAEAQKRRWEQFRAKKGKKQAKASADTGEE